MIVLLLETGRLKQMRFTVLAVMDCSLNVDETQGEKYLISSQW